MTDRVLDPALITRFDGEMEQIYWRAKNEIHYNATRFLQMFSEHGGLDTAHRLLEGDSISYGFTELYIAGRLDLTVEALVQRPEFAMLFSTEELAKARARTGGR